MRRPITITEDGRTIHVKGRGAGQLLREAGMRPIFAGSVQAYILDAHRLPDVVAYLDYRNIPVAVSAGDDT